MVHEQLEVWRGDFGKDYTDRNKVDWKDRLLIFRGILDGLAINSVLEVGCNRGHNLIALSHLLGDDSNLLWKRNFPKIYMTIFPDLVMIRKGICNIPDEIHWWLWRKGK